MAMSCVPKSMQLRQRLDSVRLLPSSDSAAQRLQAFQLALLVFPNCVMLVRACWPTNKHRQLCMGTLGTFVCFECLPVPPNCLPAPWRRAIWYGKVVAHSCTSHVFPPLSRFVKVGRAFSLHCGVELLLYRMLQLFLPERSSARCSLFFSPSIQCTWCFFLRLLVAFSIVVVRQSGLPGVPLECVLSFSQASACMCLKCVGCQLPAACGCQQADCGCLHLDLGLWRQLAVAP